MMLTISREQWGAQHGRGAPIPGPVPWVVIHHTVQPALPCGGELAAELARVREIERQHVTDEGWLGIGYQWLIGVPSGHVFEGRGWGREGAHAPGKNRDSVGIAFLCDGRTDPLSPAAIEAVRGIIRRGIQGGHIADDYEIVGHRDVWATECPGPLIYPRLEEMRP